MSFSDTDYSIDDASQSTTPSPAGLTNRVVDRIAAVTDRDPTAIEPLFTAVDPDALEALIAHESPSLRVQFEHAGCRVDVFGDGRVAVDPLD